MYELRYELVTGVLPPSMFDDDAVVDVVDLFGVDDDDVLFVAVDVDDSLFKYNN